MDYEANEQHICDICRGIGLLNETKGGNMVCRTCEESMTVPQILCRQCNEPQTVSCSYEQFAEFRDTPRHERRNIQEIMSNVPKEERELFLSGICGTCWISRMFA